MTDHGEDLIDCMARMKGDNQPFALATVVRTEDATSAKAGAKAVVRADGSLQGWIGGGCAQGAVRRAAVAALADGRARLIRVRPKDLLATEPTTPGVELHNSGCPSRGTLEIFVEPILPRPALLVAGASPTARALCGLARRAGFSVTVAALAEDLEGIDEADERIEGFDLGGAANVSRGHVVVATQGKRDSEALAAALRSPAPHVAFIGSRRKADSLKAKMAAAGIPQARIDRLRAPAGLDIGAVTPEEIALSILAEIVRDRRQSLAEAVAPIESDDAEPAEIETSVVGPSGGCVRN